jgi:DNA polymerase elongation subunit (family B)
MIRESELTDLLIFDLETSSGLENFQTLKQEHSRKADLWSTKCEKASLKEERWKDASLAYQEQTALSPEFGRIVCASFLHIVVDNSSGKTLYVGRIKSFYDNKATSTSEKDLILNPVSEMLTKIGKTGRSMKLCGHNIKKFDIPFLAKRMIMSGVEVPTMLQTWGKKPWEIEHVDTGELWAMGAWDNYASLDLLSCSLGIPSPKENMKGEYVGSSFWLYKKYEEIKDYCEEDVKCVARICHKLSKSEIPMTF